MFFRGKWLLLGHISLLLLNCSQKIGQNPPAIDLCHIRLLFLKWNCLQRRLRHPPHSPREPPLPQAELAPEPIAELGDSNQVSPLSIESRMFLSHTGLVVSRAAVF